MLCLTINAILHIETAQIDNNAAHNVGNIMFLAAFQPCQIVIHRHRRISFINRCNCHEVIGSCQQLPLICLIKVADCLCQSLQHVINLIQHIMRLSHIKVGKTKQVPVIFLPGIFQNFPTIIQHTRIIPDAPLQDFLHPHVYLCLFILNFLIHFFFILHLLVAVFHICS